MAIKDMSSHKSFVVLLPFWLNIETRCRNLAIFFFLFWEVSLLASDFFVVKIPHVFIKQKSPNNMLKGTFWKMPKKNLPHFEEKCFEIAKILDDLGRFLNFIYFFEIAIFS